MNHVATNLTQADVRTDPFPHVVLDKVFDDQTYETMVNHLPDLKFFEEYFCPQDLRESHRGMRIWSRRLQEDHRIHSVFNEYFRAHTTERFYDAMVKLFEKQIGELYPQVLEEREKRDTRAFFCFHTPTKSNSKPVRRPHLDVPEQLFLVSVYVRHPEDQSTGGDLELYRYKKRFTGFDRGSSEGDPGTIRERQVERRATVPFRGNNGVIMLNSMNALHGVTPRTETPFLRCRLNVGAWFQTSLFNPAAHMTTSDRVRDRVEALWFSYYQRAREKVDSVLCRRS